MVNRKPRVAARQNLPDEADLAQGRRDTLKEQTYVGLRSALISGHFSPGEHLTVRVLSELLGTGTMPVREAVLRLTAEGALINRSTGRIYVPRLTRGEFEQFVELRLLLEPLAARKAAARGSVGLAIVLRDIHGKLLEAARQGAVQAVLAANFRFHFTVYENSGSPVLSEHIEKLWLRAGPLMTNLLRTAAARADFIRAVSIHERLIEALKTESAPSARQAMTEIIESAAEMQRDTFSFAGQHDGSKSVTGFWAEERED